MRQIKKRYGEPVEISEAAELLSARGFVCFVKMAVCGVRKFKRGDLPQIFGLGTSQTTEIVRELRLMKYIELINNGVGRPREVFIKRQLLIYRNQKFVYR